MVAGIPVPDRNTAERRLSVRYARDRICRALRGPDGRSRSRPGLACNCLLLPAQCRRECLLSGTGLAGPVGSRPLLRELNLPRSEVERQIRLIALARCDERPRA